MNESYVLAAIAGSIVGSLLTMAGTIVSDGRRIRRQQVSSIYAEFCSAMAVLRAASDDSRPAARAQAAASLARVAIYGGPKVVKALHRFREAGGDIVANRKEFVDVVCAMRRHTWPWKRKQDIRLLIAASRQRD